jgi:alpha-ketoglutarate-dependent taurine dioxygenase
LYSLEVPSYGGDTMFVSGYAAYDTLDPAVKSKLAGSRAFHHYNYGSTVRGDSRVIPIAVNTPIPRILINGELFQKNSDPGTASENGSDD